MSKEEEEFWVELDQLARAYKAEVLDQIDPDQHETSIRLIHKVLSAENGPEFANTFVHEVRRVMSETVH